MILNKSKTKIKLKVKMKFKQNSDFHFNLFSLKMKNKEMNKETFVRFYREEISCANCKRKYILRKIKICIYSDGEIYIYTHIKKIE